MVFRAIIRDGRIELPVGIKLPDGAEVEVAVKSQPGNDSARGGRCHLGDVLKFAGTWAGDDSDEIIEEIYSSRSSSRNRPGFDD